MFKKLYNFYVSYEDLFKFCLILLSVAFLLCLIVTEFDKYINREINREIDIIEKTKEYKIFNSCKKINDKYYCWED